MLTAHYKNNLWSNQTLSCHSVMAIVGSRKCVSSTVSSRPRRPLRVTVAPHRLSSSTKETFFRRTAVSCANSIVHVNLTPPNNTACNLASSRASCRVSLICFGGWDWLWFMYRPETLSNAVLDRPRRLPNHLDRCYRRNISIW